MMYTVVWLKSAEDELTQMYLDARDKAEIKAAVEKVDVLLGSKPLEVGVFHPRLRGFRIIDEPPLRFVYAVSQEDRRVRIGRIEALW